VSQRAIEHLELVFGSELPTERAPEKAAVAARAAVKAAAGSAARAPRDEEVWCDSEAPTGVAAERPILPPPPRAPRV
jgi:hypothetical protein